MSDPLRLIWEQKRQVSKVLLDGLYDSDSPISKLLGVRTEVMGEIIWQEMLAWRTGRYFLIQLIRLGCEEQMRKGIVYR